MIIRDNELVDIQTPTGPMRTYIFHPVAAGTYPGILLFSEIFQVTGPIRRAAAMLAGHGFLVAAPEIYHEFEPAGTVLPYDEAGADRGNLLKTTKDLAAYDTDARAALDYLKAHPVCTGKLGVMGICIGGHLSVRACMNGDVLAGVCFYATDIHKHGLGKGMRDNTIDRLRDIRGEMLMIWGRQDPHVPPEGRALIHQAFATSGVRFTWHEFNGQHAFMRDEGYRYDPALARICYTLVLELFQRRLGEGDLPATEAAQSAETKH
jgi:carboxymethylenebutenolidase